ncbi:short-chain dehydrogenase [Pseudoclavibacter endophyticus]|uniref:SDR family oxidoreductase n=1 Tax=Pseudoclavibacter endophyticus TaxID=1778590 RepID=A0A6H9WCH8_9MICO|nr:SDR family oxidoreductase [Pseudoclavibacter endophyticus]KAB1648393.1 SDR family oxidoreductase [Pseudoclavibacter endophyticus]GGA72333.1 short-chain dehydrogenase [Pseudoclavibacter endophyticus]
MSTVVQPPSPSSSGPWPERVVVTGGSSGIGLGVARAFVEVGSTVGLIGRDRARLERAAATLDAGAAVVTAAADVRDEHEIGSAVDSLAEQLGGIDALVAAAGVDGEMGAPAAEVTAESFRGVLDINVVGAFLAVQRALPHLRRSPGASVTFIGSDSGFVAAPGMLAYNASKGALAQLTRALAVELFDDFGIRVNSVCPSITDTPLARAGLGVDSFDDVPYPVQTVDDVAWAVLSVASRRARAINGVNLLSDFGYTGRSSFPA